MGEGWVHFFLSFLSPNSCLAFFFFLQPCKRQKSTLETKGHSKTCSDSSTFISSLCKPGFCCSFFLCVCVCKDQIPLYKMSWPGSQLLHSSWPLTLLGTVICSVDSFIVVNGTRVIFSRQKYIVSVKVEIVFEVNI